MSADREVLLSVDTPKRRLSADGVGWLYHEQEGQP